MMQHPCPPDNGEEVMLRSVTSSSSPPDQQPAQPRPPGGSVAGLPVAAVSAPTSRATSSASWVDVPVVDSPQGRSPRHCSAAESLRRFQAMQVDESIVRRINHSFKFQDFAYEYRYVELPITHPFMTDFNINEAPRNRILVEDEWRLLGIRQTKGWEHAGYGQFEPNVLLFRRKLDENDRSSTAATSSSNSPSRSPAWNRHQKLRSAAGRRLRRHRMTSPSSRQDESEAPFPGSQCVRGEWIATSADPSALGLSPSYHSSSFSGFGNLGGAPGATRPGPLRGLPSEDAAQSGDDDDDDEIGDDDQGPQREGGVLMVRGHWNDVMGR